MTFGLVLALLTLLALTIGAAFAFGAPILAVPLFLGLLVVGGGTVFGGRHALRRYSQVRRMRAFRQQARAQPIDYTEADRRTMV